MDANDKLKGCFTLEESCWCEGREKYLQDQINFWRDVMHKMKEPTYDYHMIATLENILYSYADNAASYL